MSRVLLLVLCLSVLPTASAAPPQAPEPLAWRCWYDPVRPAMACLLEEGPPERGEFHPGALSGPETFRALQVDPGRFADEPILVPLYAPPIDMKRAEQLARNVVCYRHPRCRVAFGVAGSTSVAAMPY